MRDDDAPCPPSHHPQPRLIPHRTQTRPVFTANVAHRPCHDPLPCLSPGLDLNTPSAGVAAAFASPIGGVLFTIEEGVSFYSTSVFWRGFLATCVAVLTLHFLVELTVSRCRNHG